MEGRRLEVFRELSNLALGFVSKAVDCAVSFSTGRPGLEDRMIVRSGVPVETLGRGLIKTTQSEPRATLVGLAVAEVPFARRLFALSLGSLMATQAPLHAHLTSVRSCFWLSLSPQAGRISNGTSLRLGCLNHSD